MSEPEGPIQIDPQPEHILKYLFEVVWNIPSVKRDHFHSDPQNWEDEPRKKGMIRTYCKICGDFIGYRPALKAGVGS